MSFEQFICLSLLHYSLLRWAAIADRGWLTVTWCVCVCVCVCVWIHSMTHSVLLDRWGQRSRRGQQRFYTRKIATSIGLRNEKHSLSLSPQYLSLSFLSLSPYPSPSSLLPPPSSLLCPVLLSVLVTHTHTRTHTHNNSITSKWSNLHTLRRAHTHTLFFFFFDCLHKPHMRLTGEHTHAHTTGHIHVSTRRISHCFLSQWLAESSALPFFFFLSCNPTLFSVCWLDIINLISVSICLSSALIQSVQWRGFFFFFFFLPHSMWLLSVHPWFNCGAAHINYDPSNRSDKEVGEENK